MIARTPDRHPTLTRFLNSPPLVIGAVVACAVASAWIEHHSATVTALVRMLLQGVAVALVVALVWVYETITTYGWGVALLLVLVWFGAALDRITRLLYEMRELLREAR